jgi:hypothetical protein
MLGCCFHLDPNQIIKYIAYGIYSCLERAVDHHHFYTRIHIAVPAVDAQPLMASYICYWDGNIKAAMYRAQHFSLWLMISNVFFVYRKNVTHTRAKENPTLIHGPLNIYSSLHASAVCAIDGHNLIISIVIAIERRWD